VGNVRCCLCINQSGCGYFAECGKLPRGTLRKIKCRTFHKLPLIAFPHFAAERIAKLPFARIVQLMCSRSIATSGVTRCLPSVLFVVHLPANKVVFLQFLLTSKSVPHSKCHIISLVNVIGFNLCN